MSRSAIVLIALILGTSAGAVYSQNYEKDVRKIERKARQLSRQAERFEKNRTNYDAIRRSAEDIRRTAERIGKRAEDLEKRPAENRTFSARGCSQCDLGKTADDFLKRLERHCSAQQRRHGAWSQYDEGRDLPSALKRTAACLPADIRRKIRRGLRKLPAEIRDVSAVRTARDVLRHPRKYRREECIVCRAQ